MGTSCTAPVPTTTVDHNMITKRIISTGGKNDDLPSVIYHSKIFVEVSFYTKVTGLIINQPVPPSENESEAENGRPALWYYTLDY